MFNFNQFSQAVNQFELQNDAYDLTANGSKRAKLYVFTPTFLPQQTLRSFNYNFSNTLVQELASSKEQDFRKNLHQPEGTPMGNAVNLAVLPTLNGINMDTTLINNQWSFVLILDKSYPTRNGVLQTASPITRTIATGYATEEPVNPNTNTVNPHAILMFTKVDVINVAPRMSGGEFDRSYIVKEDSSIVDERIGQLSGPKNLFTMTPGELVNNTAYEPMAKDMCVAPGPSCVTNIKANEGSKKISNNEATPRHHLGNIVQALNASISSEKNLEGKNICANGVSVLDDPSIAGVIEKVATNMPNYNVTTPGNTIDVTQPMSMECLCYMYPDLHVFPIAVPTKSIWDAAPQGVQTRRNQMSSLLAASIQNLITQVGIASISFRYDSFTGPDKFGLGSKDGVFYPERWCPISTMSDKTQFSAIKWFETMFKDWLVPVIRTVGGEFRLLCHIDIGGYVLIDLIYEDERLGMSQGEGWYETSGKLGGYLTPYLGTESQWSNNASQLMELISNVASKQLYCGPFGQQPQPVFDGTAQVDLFSGFTNAGNNLNNPIPNQDMGQQAPQQPQQRKPSVRTTLKPSGSTPEILNGTLY